MKVLLSPIFSIMSLILYPNIFIRLFSPQGDGHNIIDKGVCIHLPGNAGGKEGSFYAPVYWYWPFFSLEEHVLAIIEKIKTLDNEGYEFIEIGGISMGGAAGVVVMAELLRMKKEEGLVLKTPIQFFISNTFNKLEKVALMHIKQDGVMYFVALPIIFIALPALIASLIFTIPSAITFFLVSILTVAISIYVPKIWHTLLHLLSSPAEEDGIHKMPLSQVYGMSNNTLILLLTFVEIYLLFGTGFVYIPMVLCSITSDTFTQYTIPSLLGILGCDLSIHHYFDYILKNRDEAKNNHGLTIKVSQVSAQSDVVLGNGILCTKDNADIFIMQGDHMYSPYPACNSCY